MKVIINYDDWYDLDMVETFKYFDVDANKWVVNKEGKWEYE